MIKVIVGIKTYNLEKYIAEALDSVLEQKTNFDFRVIVADDASTDGTRQILAQYKRKYPDKLEVVVGDKNVGSMRNNIRILERARDAEYFSLLDGDDAWVGENRLQHQVDFLDSHREYVLCSGQTNIIRDGKIVQKLPPDNWKGKTYTFLDYFKTPVLFHTSGLLLRNVIYSKGVPEYFYRLAGTFEECSVEGEDFRRLRHLEMGPLYVLPEVVSNYRIHEKGMWSGSGSAKKAIWSAIGRNFIKKYYSPRGGHTEVRSYIEKMAADEYQNMWRVLINEKYIFPKYRLGKYETELLTGLITELSREGEMESGITVKIMEIAKKNEKFRL